MEPAEEALQELADYAEQLRTANISCSGRFVRLQRAIVQAVHDAKATP